MDPERLDALLAELETDRRTGRNVGDRLCETCIEVLDVSGVGIMLMTDGEHHGTLAVSNDVMEVVEELQFTLGEGPCIDAFHTSTPVLEPDLGHPVDNRWPAFSGPAVDAGVRALFGFPLRSGQANLGALDVYVDRPGDLEPDQMTDALVLASVIADTVLALQAEAGPGELPGLIDSSVEYRAIVHQASGMVSAQLRIPVADALVRIRAHAYTSNRLVNDVSKDIVDRRLRLD